MASWQIGKTREDTRLRKTSVTKVKNFVKMTLNVGGLREKPVPVKSPIGFANPQKSSSSFPGRKKLSSHDGPPVVFHIWIRKSPSNRTPWPVTSKPFVSQGGDLTARKIPSNQCVRDCARITSSRPEWAPNDLPQFQEKLREIESRSSPLEDQVQVPDR